MSKYLLGVAAAAFLMVGVGGTAQANECGLSAGQISGGWGCELVSTSGDPVTSYVQAGQSHMCKVFETSTTTTQWVATNPAGNEVDAHSTEPVVVEGDAEKVGGNVPCP
jgi:hypothetical protein